MRSKDSKIQFINDMAKVMAGAMGSFGETRNQVKNMVRDGVEQVMAELDMVTRTDFERVEALAEKARERQIELEKRIAALEKQLKAKKTPTRRSKSAK
jgi:hypothetical protein